MTRCNRCGALIQYSDMKSTFVCPVHGSNHGIPESVFA